MIMYNTTVCNNLRIIMYKLNMSADKLFKQSFNKLKLKMYKQYQEDVSNLVKCHANVIKECIEMRDDICINVLDKTFCNSIINYLCTV